ncbi:MAG: PDZ domain-containing protein [Rhodospirillales bacterium]|jgi:carboxyl-terminal processing protease|nr:PDZ domain-containing protein [Rhodospirillales bacterium]
MINKIRDLRHSLFTTALLLLAACSGIPDPQSISNDPFPRGDAEEIFAAGFGNITDKYINEITPGEYVIEGLKGLTSLDTTISIEKADNRVILKRLKEPVATYIAPKTDDIDGWAFTAAQLTAESRKHSTDLMDATAEELYEVIFDGAISKLDIYSRYAGNTEADNNRAKRDGFGGIGVYLRKENNKILINKILAETPASMSGLHKDDEVLIINGNTVSGLRASAAAKSLRGPIGSTVQLTVNCINEGIINLEVEREHIIPKTVSAMLNNGILHLKIKNFNHDTADSVIRELDKAFQLENQGLKGVVLDLRGNPGGLLKQSIQMADAFLTDGNILDTKGRHIDSLQHYEAGGDDKAHGLPVVVLVDGGSASASEIVAAALQDGERAVVMGTVSYGKGTVQTVIRLPNDGELIITWSRFMTPSGYALHGLGVLPAICTSGINQAATPELLATLEDQSNTLDTLGLWRQVAIDNTAERNDLRSNCPPEKHAGAKDLDLARMLIEDSALYYRALDLTAETAEAIE